MADEKTNSDIGSWVGQAWNSAKIYQGSNIVKHYDAIVETGTIESLGNHVQKLKGENLGIDHDAKDDDRLKKYNFAKITPTKNLGELKNPSELYIITDENGHDIGTLEITEDGTLFKISPKIQEANRKIIQELAGDNTKLKEQLEKMYEVKTFDDLTEKLAKGERIAVASQEQIKDDLAKSKSEELRQMGKEVDGIEQHEDPEEEKAINSIPSDMRADVIAMCREKNISIKEVLVVDCAKCLSEEMRSDEAKIKEDGGPVILVQAHNKGAELEDDVYMFQDGQQLPNSEKDKARILELMNQHKGEGTIPELSDTKQSKVEAGIYEARQEAEVYVTNEIGKFPPGEVPDDIEEKIMQTAHKNFDASVQGVMKKNDYVPGKDVIENIHNEHDEVQEHVENEIEDKEEETTEDSWIKNRWASADPHNPQN